MEVLASQDKEDALLVITRLFDEKNLIALGTAFRTRPAAVHQRLFQLRGGPSGNASAVSELTKAIKRQSEVRPIRRASLAALFQGHADERLRRIETPAGWRVDRGGVYTERVGAFPVTIRRISTDVDRSQLRWTITWQRDGKSWQEADIDRR